MEDDEVPDLIETIPSPINKRIPLTLITGFLGAGKSTLLQRILSERHGYRIAVIVNEFGDTTDIEARAISVAEGSASSSATEMSTDLLELPNGCLCCSIKDTGVAAIENLMKRKGAFDYILLETTGLADPGPIVSIFWRNEEFPSSLGADVYLDGVVCIVDAVYGAKQLKEDNTETGIGESLRQLAAADVILLNKCDLSTPSALEMLEAQVLAINPETPIHRTTKGVIDVRKVIGLDVFRSRGLPATSTQSHAHPHENHTHSISSLQIPVPVLSATQMEKLDEWIRSILWERRLPTASKEIEVLRTKGLLLVRHEASGQVEEHMLQAVRELYEISPLSADDAHWEGQEGKLVLIGKGLDDAVRSSFREHVLEG